LLLHRRRPEFDTCGTRRLLSEEVHRISPDPMLTVHSSFTKTAHSRNIAAVLFETEPFCPQLSQCLNPLEKTGPPLRADGSPGQSPWLRRRVNSICPTSVMEVGNFVFSSDPRARPHLRLSQHINRRA
jgi:hypothetical protein